jgi:chorismate mutase
MKANYENEIVKLIRKKNLIISGPCSAENEDQLLKTALALKKGGKVDILRAGIWKPRTSPGGFEGIGVKGLSWLLNVKKAVEMPTAVEVASGRHVEEALSFETDVLWIGARSTSNPFSVQDIADALKGTNQTVLVKNPINADIKLWIGAIERLQKAGLDNIGLIHRGFSLYGSTEFRNVPLWQIPIEMMRLFPSFPMLCDPSHICGKKDNLHEIAQKSIDFAYSGLIIESHCCPHQALTDRDQQITPLELEQLLGTLTYKSTSLEIENLLSDLNVLRDRIDLLDNEILALISSRMAISKTIGEVKRGNKMTVLQSNRWSTIVNNNLKKCKKLNLDKTFVKAFLETVHTESIRIQDSLKT